MCFLVSARLHVVNDKLRKMVFSLAPLPNVPAKSMSADDSNADIDAPTSQVNSAAAGETVSASRWLETKFHVFNDEESGSVAAEINGNGPRTFFAALDNVLETKAPVVLLSACT